MIACSTSRRTYDHRIRQLVCATRDPRIFPDLRIPRSTTASWIVRGSPSVETSSRFDQPAVELETRVLLLERRVQVLAAVVRLLLALVRVSGFRLESSRLPAGRAKASLLHTIEGASGILSLRSCLRVLHLSPARYHAWKQSEVVCELDDRPSCPRRSFPAHRPDETWHIDVTVIKLLDGTRTYLHAIIDNLSRRILALRLVERLNPATTCEILDEAGRHLHGSVEDTIVIADSGIENAAGMVDDFFESGRLRRIFALVDVSFSNSLIERWWSNLRYAWLYLHDLDTIAKVRGLVAFYVQQHNSVMPHAAFNGQTPDEVYFQVGEAVPHLLTHRRVAARAGWSATPTTSLRSAAGPRGLQSGDNYPDTGGRGGRSTA